MLSPLLVGLTLGLVALATIPTYRLFVAGWGPARLLIYLVVLVALGFAVVLGIGPLRVMVPLLVVVVAAPYVLAMARARLRRTLGRWPGRRRPPARVVGDGPGRSVRPDEPTAPADDRTRPPSP